MLENEWAGSHAKVVRWNYLTGFGHGRTADKPSLRSLVSGTGGGFRDHHESTGSRAGMPDGTIAEGGKSLDVARPQSGDWTGGRSAALDSARTGSEWRLPMARFNKNEPRRPSQGPGGVCGMRTEVNLRMGDAARGLGVLSHLRQSHFPRRVVFPHSRMIRRKCVQSDQGDQRNDPWDQNAAKGSVIEEGHLNLTGATEFNPVAFTRQKNQ
jgi:hypothetical protein